MYSPKQIAYIEIDGVGGGGDGEDLLLELARLTRGGGTALATQRECLEMLGCHGSGKADKFAEICAGVVLAGETSLSAAVIHGDWVSSHNQLGRNRK